MRPNRLLFSVIFIVCCSLSLVAQQDERVLSYDSDITLNEDGSMTVRESIRVHANGVKIKHGIYRDFPTEYRDKLGIRKRVPFEILSVTRDGRSENYHTASRSNGVRVFVGPRFSRIPSGDYTYAITYRTDRQIGFYKDREELYWNVTGNGWDFPIDHATATV
jgi:hypothetical protein